MGRTRGSSSPAAEFVTGGGFHWLYYRGCDVGHDNLHLDNVSDGACAIGLLRFRQDGLAYLTTRDANPDVWAVVRTRWFELQGSTLLVNVDFKGKYLLHVTHSDFRFQNSFVIFCFVCFQVRMVPLRL